MKMFEEHRIEIYDVLYFTEMCYLSEDFADLVNVALYGGELRVSFPCNFSDFMVRWSSM